MVYGRGAVLNMTGTALRWFDFALNGVQNEYATALQPEPQHGRDERGRDAGVES